MRLPRADALVVEREKIIDYLLNLTHRYVKREKGTFYFGSSVRPTHDCGGRPQCRHLRVGV